MNNNEHDDESDFVDESELDLPIADIYPNAPRSYKEAYWHGTYDETLKIADIVRLLQKEVSNNLRELNSTILLIKEDSDSLIKESETAFCHRVDRLYKHYTQQTHLMTEQATKDLRHIATVELQQIITQSLDDAHRKAALIPVITTRSTWIQLIAISVAIGAIVGAVAAYIVLISH
ncbi:hypothetical protein [Photobacterium carnosum]|uniref:hypothetical protein n=1 Tax=Photobacterium carnosum TaxID=2023717 RepID=UPI001E4B895F|nr:hypothetical protein [Photobacterium carnosum]MCD9538961.1 hypothetical protein [Photobacterium carnosum]MCF2163685.1 hypothetical protein [Photobacterium carnosum]MCF2307801.1 hypothetical protein [Photobacterium carnosum]